MIKPLLAALLTVCTAVPAACIAVPAACAPMFTDAERATIAAFWNQPGRYRMSAGDGTVSSGPWDVRLTPGASRWLRAYRGATGASTLPPGRLTKPSEGEMVAWEEWVTNKIAYDRWQAQTDADGANAASGIAAQAKAMPPYPGPIPAGLLQAAGNPPPFAAAIARRKYTVTFDGGEAFDYHTNVRMRERFAYYRWDQGTVGTGSALRSLPAEELDKLFASTGMTPLEQHVMHAVSQLEGGFESVNTYDTGYVSVGFIQFTTGDEGRGSLLEVMASEKKSSPDDFTRDFHNLGMDVNQANTLVVVDPSSGAELTGADAVMKVIDDKRLVAIFQRAGRHSTPFRAAQISVAKSHYWPANDAFSIVVDGRKIQGKVGDVIRSEAGIATLYDRKVNRGSVAPFADTVQALMQEKGLKSVAEAARYEREIITRLIYRVNFLEHPELTQPE